MENLEAVRIVSTPPAAKEITLLTGFPGAGLVGSIALQYLVETLEFTQIGSVTSRFLPQISLATNGITQAPIRFYEKDNFVAVISDVPIPPQLSYDVSAGILKWMEENTKVSEVVVFGGLNTGGEGERVFGVSTTEKGVERIKKVAEILPALSIAGVSGSLLIEAGLRNIPASGFLVETNYNVDPRAAAAALNAIKSLYGFKIETAELLEQADHVEAMMHQLAEDVVEQEEGEPKPFSTGEQMMYG